MSMPGTSLASSAQQDHGDAVSSQTSVLNRAERFEDEKRRIIETCFQKKDPEGFVLESYITHIRVIEDAHYPASPPPPQSTGDSKKQRVIIVAVKRSGRVRLHKGRENPNLSFSIGKTWNLDDLTGVQSYDNWMPVPEGDILQKEWAGLAGFTVSLQKPYFWMANSQKEKDFFVASLVKIYKKYTNGRLPELIGFTDEELTALKAESGRAKKEPAPPPPPSSRAPEAHQLPSPPEVQHPPPAARPASRNRSGSQMRPTIATNVSSFRNEHSRDGNSATSQYPPPSRIVSTASSNLPPPSISGFTERSQGSLNAAAMSPERRDSPFSARSETPDRLATAPPPVMPNALRVPLRSASRTSKRDGPAEVLATTASAASPPDVSQSRVATVKRDSSRAPSEQSGGDSFHTPLENPKQSGYFSPVPSERSINGDVPQPKPRDRPKTPIEQVQERLERAPSAKKQTLQSPERPVPEQQPGTDSKNPTEAYRPGLGPMLKKRGKIDTAALLRKAAVAHTGFMPRAGGAGERLRQQGNSEPRVEDEVFRSPTGPVDVQPKTNGVGARSPASEETPAKSTAKPGPPQVTVNDRAIDSLGQVVASSAGSAISPKSEEKAIPVQPRSDEARRQEARVQQVSRNIEAIGINASVLHSRSIQVDTVLREFGWTDEGCRAKKVDVLETEIKRELARLDAGAALTSMDHKDDRIDTVQKLLDRAINECEEFDSLLTLYAVELGGLSEDIEYIEEQSQGLQVQTANQKLLQNELEELLRTINISSKQLQILRTASLENTRELELIEGTLSILYKALMTMDPTIRQNAQGVHRLSQDGVRSSDLFNTELGSMQALQEKKGAYRNDCIDFFYRLEHFMNAAFQGAAGKIARNMQREREEQLRRVGKPHLDPRNHQNPRAELWHYSPMMLFAREVDAKQWEQMMRAYQRPTAKLYKDEFKENIAEWKNVTRPFSEDDPDILFTASEKDLDNTLSTVARKTAVKRGHTIAKALRTPISAHHDGPLMGRPSLDKIQEGKVHPFEAFAGALEASSTLILMEQNFVSEFFYITSQNHLDFSETVATIPPEARLGRDLRRKQVWDADREMAKKLRDCVGEIFVAWPSEIQAFMEFTVASDPLQGVGVLFALEMQIHYHEDSNQEFLLKNLRTIHGKLIGMFIRFVDEQVRAVEDTKIKLTKRRGTITFMKIFPLFSNAIQNILAASGRGLPPINSLPVFETVNEAYGKILRAMFDSLRTIAQDTPSTTSTTGFSTFHLYNHTDPEDKEALNYHILMIENMNHYIDSVDYAGNTVLMEWTDKAKAQLRQHMDLYIDAVIRRPIGKLLDFIESSELILKPSSSSALRTPLTGSSITSSSIGTAGPMSPLSQAVGIGLGAGSRDSTAAGLQPKSLVKKLLGAHDGKEVRKAVEMLRKRVEKHFGEGDEPEICARLVEKVGRECEGRVLEARERLVRVLKEGYVGESGLEVEFSRGDVEAGFRRG